MSEEKINETAELPESNELAQFCANLADDKKATDILILNLKEFSAIADYLIICTGTSAPHLRSISESVLRGVREKYAIHGNSDGVPESGWMIADFGDVMVHVFTQEARNRYQLETLWGDAPQTEAIAKIKEKAATSRLR